MSAAILPGTTISHYRVVEVLGEGGMGCVYLAEDLVLGRRAALKLIRAADDSDVMRQRLLREARAASALLHPNVCTIYEAGIWEGEPFIAMQYVDGTALSETKRELSTGAILRIAAGVAEGLAEAHRLGLVHRDIKPQNVMVSDRAVVILDFGLARTIDRRQDEQLTANDSVAGTAPYMSPEQLRLEPLDGRSDVFSFGVMLYELLAGRRPFDRPSVADTIGAILRDDPPPIGMRGGAGAALEALVFRMLQKDARRRPTAAEVARELDVLRRQGDAADTPTQVIGAETMRIVPAAPTASRITSSVANVDPEAAKLYLRARELWKKRNPPALRNAIVLLQQAIELEPEYARAYAAHGDCKLFLGFLQVSSPDAVFPKAEAALARAVELEPTLAEAHASRGFLETVYGWNAKAAEEALDEAVRLDGKLATAHHWRGLYLRTQRRFDEADAALRRAAALDPLSPIFATACAFVPMDLGEPDAAIRICRAVIESEPAFIPVHFYLGLALEQSGRIAEAVAEYQTAVDMAASDAEATPALAHALFRAGRNDEAEGVVARLRNAAQERFISPFFFAVAALGAGRHDETLGLLDQAVSLRAMRMYDLHLDHRFAPLREHPRFLAVLERIGLGR